jgi:hypothetical protein
MLSKNLRKSSTIKSIKPVYIQIDIIKAMLYYTEASPSLAIPDISFPFLDYIQTINRHLAVHFCLFSGVPEPLPSTVSFLFALAAESNVSVPACFLTQGVTTGGQAS